MVEGEFRCEKTGGIRSEFVGAVFRRDIRVGEEEAVKLRKLVQFRVVCRSRRLGEEAAERLDLFFGKPVGIFFYEFAPFALQKGFQLIPFDEVAQSQDFFLFHVQRDKACPGVRVRTARVLIIR
mgnify:CR=1 FL=1